MNLTALENTAKRLFSNNSHTRRTEYVIKGLLSYTSKYKKYSKITESDLKKIIKKLEKIEEDENKKMIKNREEIIFNLFKREGIKPVIKYEKVSYWEGKPLINGIFLGKTWAESGTSGIINYTQKKCDMNQLLINTALQLELIVEFIKELNGHEWWYEVAYGKVEVRVGDYTWEEDYSLASKWDRKEVFTF